MVQHQECYHNDEHNVLDGNRSGIDDHDHECQFLDDTPLETSYCKSIINEQIIAFCPDVATIVQDNFIPPNEQENEYLDDDDIAIDELANMRSLLEEAVLSNITEGNPYEISPHIGETNSDGCNTNTSVSTKLPLHYFSYMNGIHNRISFMQ